MVVISPEICSLSSLCARVRVVTAPKQLLFSSCWPALHMYRSVETKPLCTWCVYVSVEQSQIPVMLPLSSVDAGHCRSPNLGI